MSTFYLLPTRPELGERFASLLNAAYPGLAWPKKSWSQLAEAIGEIASQQPDVFVVYREELPAGADTTAALGDGFGAASGDEVIEAATGKRWRIGSSEPHE